MTTDSNLSVVTLFARQFFFMHKPCQMTHMQREYSHVSLEELRVKSWRPEPICKIKARFLSTYASLQSGNRCEIKQQAGNPRAFACLRKEVGLFSLA